MIKRKVKRHPTTSVLPHTWRIILRQVLCESLYTFSHGKRGGYVLFALFFFAIAGVSWAGQASAGRLVHLKTSDGWTLAAWYVPAGKESGVVLIHGLAAGKGEWHSLEGELTQRGIATLAVDLRGHGDSLGPDKKRDWKTFIDHGPAGEWAHMWKDAEAGVRYLNQHGCRKVGIVGASIGANIALSEATHLPRTRCAVLLSPGLEYQGLRAGDFILSYGIRPLLLAASLPDDYAYQSVAMLRKLRLSVKMPVDLIEAKSGHGVQMFSDPDVLKKVADWIAAHLN